MQSLKPSGINLSFGKGTFPEYVRKVADIGLLTRVRRSPAIEVSFNHAALDLHVKPVVSVHPGARIKLFIVKYFS